MKICFDTGKLKCVTLEEAWAKRCNWKHAIVDFCKACNHFHAHEVRQLKETATKEEV